MEPKIISEEESLWECLHDGTLENLTSDLIERAVTLVVDVPYIWEFHKLSDDTRFRITLEGVRLVQALTYTPWPGDFILPPNLKWEDQETLRKQNYAKGRMESADWNTASAKFDAKQYGISDANLLPSDDQMITIELDLTDYHSDYLQVRLRAERVRFFVNPHRELSLQEFLALGEAYWEDFAKDRPAAPKSEEQN